MTDNLKWDDLVSSAVMNSPKFDVERIKKTMQELLKDVKFSDRPKLPHNVKFDTQYLGTFNYPVQGMAADATVRAMRNPPAPKTFFREDGAAKCMHCKEDEYSHVDRSKCVFGPETFAVGVFMERPASPGIRSWTCTYCNRTSYRGESEGPPERCTKCGCKLMAIPRPAGRW